MTIINIQKFKDKDDWSIARSRALYHIPGWSDGYFDINDAGHLVVHPQGKAACVIDIYKLAQDIRREGQPLPVLVRFLDVLKDRIDTLHDAFGSAFQQHNYLGSITSVYPIKVNQQRRVVETIVNYGQQRGGLEAGSKPELLTSIALSRPGGTIICNGYKDSEFVRLALIGQQLGLRVYIVIEKLSELDTIIDCANAMSITPLLGIRVRLGSVAEGNWQNSGGEKSKFGLHADQVLQAIDRLKDAGLCDCLQLLHFHIGSQITNIRHFQYALHEGARYYAELHRLVPISVIDVGGGLGVDYEGTRSRNPSSMNYTMQAYADAVVHAIVEICHEQNLPHPAIVTESGRALTAQHAMLITNVINIEHAHGLETPQPAEDDDPQIIKTLWTILQSITPATAQRAYQDALHYFEEAKEMFNHGLLDLPSRARVEGLFFSICRKINPLLEHDQGKIVEELHNTLADKYFCNFSLFQSMPDSWAIDQVFPVVPLHRLDERPDQRATIQDLTCDSDGRINFYVEDGNIENSLPLHKPEAHQDYLIGIFLLGAYQEILGDMHNLFGDTGSVNIEISNDGGYHITEPYEGDSVSDLLRCVHIDIERLKQIYRDRIGTSGLTPECQEEYLQYLV
ncbi:MAG: biosynthetic arginine decarboxylase, partial [Gammaproteobacteria bacterium]